MGDFVVELLSEVYPTNVVLALFELSEGQARLSASGTHSGRVPALSTQRARASCAQHALEVYSTEVHPRDKVFFNLVSVTCCQLL